MLAKFGINCSLTRFLVLCRLAPDPLQIRQLRARVRRLEALLEMRQQEFARLDVAAEVAVAALHEHIDYHGASPERAGQNQDGHRWRRHAQARASHLWRSQIRPAV